MRCTSCGNEIPDDAKFCSRCGTPVAAGPHTSVPMGPEQGSSGEKHGGPARARRRLTAIIAAASVVIVAALGVAAWLLLPRLLGPKIVLDLQDVPDEAFRTYLAQNVDEDGNGGIDQEEADAVTAIGDTSADAAAGNGLAGLGITSLEGISAFSNLTELVCADNQLTDLDLSANGDLASVSCSGNEDLSSLTLPKGDVLGSVHATDCNLESVDLTGLPGLTDVLLDDAVEVFGDAATVDAQTHENLELLATLYNYGVEPSAWKQTISTVRAQAGDADVDEQLVRVSLTLGNEFALTYGETDKNATGDPLGVATSYDPGIEYTLTDDGVRTILSTFYGSAPDDLSYLHDVSNFLAYDGSSGVWSVSVSTAPVGETVWADNFTSYGTYLEYDLALLVQAGFDTPAVYYYHVVAQESDDGALGYRMVSLSAADDLSASFPDAVAACDEAISMQTPLGGE